MKQDLDMVTKTMATKQQLDEFADGLRAELTKQPKKVKDIESEAEMKHPNWDEWKRLKKECHAFDNTKAQFILVAGIVPSSEAQYSGLLSKVQWHAVIDCDPDSETGGLYQAFGLNDDKQSLSDMWVPGKVFQHKSSDLALAINFLRLPWLFARGRTKDTATNQPRKSFQEWSKKWISAIVLFLTVVAENLDAHRPVVTLILSFDGSMNDYLKKIFTRLDEQLGPLALSSAQYVVLDTGNAPSIDFKSEDQLSYPIKRFRLPTSLFSFGLAVCLGCSPKSSKSLPSGISGVPVFITNSDFLYYSEFLTLLYEGCENEEFGKNPVAVSDECRSEIIEKHRHAFLSGQTISFLSLNHDHDATRDYLAKLTSNIYEYMAQKPVPPSAVIEIMHYPGTGGSTLARRTLWNLRQQFPTAIAKSSLSVHTLDEEATYVENVCERIQALEELCFAVPLILIDGETFVFRRPNLSRMISDRLASHGSKAVILHCLRATKFTESVIEPSPYGTWLKPKLSITERERFKDKYSDSLKSFKKESSFSRSFHFPLCAFVDEFSSKMKDIVARTINELDRVEIAVISFVALMQKYAAQPVPLSLIFKLFLQKREIDQSMACNSVESEECSQPLVPTYDEIYNSLTDSLRVLLVQSGSMRIRDHTYGTCDLQHIVVAGSVLTKLFGETRKYYEYMEQYLKDLLALESLKLVEKMDVRLFENLFLHYKELDPKVSFSLLIEELKKHLPPNERVGKLLKHAASVFPSARFYSHVARYFVYSHPRNFELAETMVDSGFLAIRQHESKTILHEMRGLICRIRLSDYVENGKILTVEELEALASTAIRNYNSAITYPLSRPNPLVGKVQVWVKCLEWISKTQCKGNVADVVRYLSKEATEFFRNILSESFYHLDIVERLVATHSVADIEFTHEKVIECKMKLSFVRAKAKYKASISLRHGEVMAECERLSKLAGIAAYSKRELRRLKVYYFLNKDGNGVKLEFLKAEEIRYLYQLLRELVEEDNDYRFAEKLFRVATYLPPQEPLSLDDAIGITEAWKADSNSNPYVHFHSFVLYFLKVLLGDGVAYGAKYEESLKKCVDLSYSFVNRSNAIYYLRNQPGESGLSALVERAALRIGAGDDYWKQASRKTLWELEGRVKMKPRGRKRSHQKPEMFFELINSGIRIDVGRNQMQLSGQLGKDYQLEQLVKFVVSFSLRGPTAHGFVLQPC
ncbi:uncharacterized protein LOC134182138 [Corticium candelabrum]|uniref:uncharacterized protein LOC134182138 n=1 Tax=Corticium candelabrum TaxID=121492 RepID=UPI002E25BEAE|nr:uncharacterized protein LOC134182138 [Corticium candelabrum]